MAQWTTNAALNGALRAPSVFPAPRTAAPVRLNRVVAPAFKANPLPRRAACREPITSARAHALVAARWLSRLPLWACWCWAGRGLRSRTTTYSRETFTTASAPSCAMRSWKPIWRTSRSISCSWEPTGRTTAKRRRNSPAISSAATASSSRASTRWTRRRRSSPSTAIPW